MAKVLVKFCNIIIKFNHCPIIWSKAVDVMIEKGKGPRLGKMRMLGMIEAYMQLIKRVFLGGSMSEKVEKENLLSKRCYIETVLLEKILIFDCEIKQKK